MQDVRQAEFVPRLVPGSKFWWHDEFYSLLPPIAGRAQAACSLTSSKGQTGRKVGTQNHWAVTVLTGTAARLPKDDDCHRQSR